MQMNEINISRVEEWKKQDKIQFTQKLLSLAYVLLVMFSVHGFSRSLILFLHIGFMGGSLLTFVVAVILFIFNLFLLTQVVILVKQRKRTERFRLKMVSVWGLVAGLWGALITLSRVDVGPLEIADILMWVAACVAVLTVFIGHILVWVSLYRGRVIDNNLLVQEDAYITHSELQAVRANDKRLGYIFLGVSLLLFLGIAGISSIIDTQDQALKLMNANSSIVGSIVGIPALLSLTIGFFYVFVRHRFITAQPSESGSINSK